MESHCFSFREIPHTTKLFSSFLDHFDEIASYYAHPPTVAGVLAAAREVRLDPAARRTLVETLREQNARSAPAQALDSATSRNLDRLAAGAVAIVTGQQVGLFSGPVFSLYKAISAVRWADEITRRGIEAVPVFWLATEDHDLAEVNQSFWNTRGGLARYELPANQENEGHRVGEIALGDHVQALAAQAGETLEGPFAGEVARALRESYTPGDTYGSAFGKLMARLLAGRGIVFLDPLDARLHRLAAPVYARALHSADALRDALLARSKELETSGLHAQVKVTREMTLLFYNVNGRREPVRQRDGNFFAGESSFSRAELRAAIEKTPEAFTGSVLLRPVIQDTLLPTAAYVGGPAEIAYMAQAQVAYKQILGRMPAILPRASFTLVEPAVHRLLGKYDLEIGNVFQGRQHIRAKMEQKLLPEGLTRQFDADEEAIRRIFEAYAKPFEQLDQTLLGALRSAERKVLHQFAELKGRAGRAENLRTGVLDRHERILLDALYPHHELQERSLCGLPWLAAYGSELLDKLSQGYAITGTDAGTALDGSQGTTSSTNVSVESTPSPRGSQHQIVFL